MYNCAQGKALEFLTQIYRTECLDLFMEYIYLFTYFIYCMDDEANNDEGENVSTLTRTSPKYVRWENMRKVPLT
jgi:hypothetical protein